MRSTCALLSSAAGVGALVTSGAAFAESTYSLPKDISTEGHRIDWLLNVTIGFIAVLFVAMVAWMLYSVLFHNEKHKARYDHGDSKRAGFLAFGIAAFVFFVVDGNLFVNSTIDMGEVFWNFKDAEAREGAVLIEVNARQWVWQARYPGPDKRFDTEDDAVTTNDIRVPVGAPVVIQLAASDVVHNLYIPNLRVKVDAMPGQIARAWFAATETGRYEIACAQHCGANHYKMRAELRVLPQQEFDEWLAQKVADSRQLYDADDEKGNWGWKWKEN